MSNEAAESRLLLGLTGGIACGKSTVGYVLEKQGFSVLDADDVAHETMTSSGECFDDVVRAFSADIVRADGEIDRRAMGELVFSDERKRALLNGIVHPVVRRKWREWAEACRAEKRNACVIIPLLFEVNEVDGWDAVVCVTSPRSTAIERLEERGLSASEAEARIESQMPVREKAERADYVIVNDGSIEDLETRTKELLESIVVKEK